MLIFKYIYDNNNNNNILIITIVLNQLSNIVEDVRNSMP